MIPIDSRYRGWGYLRVELLTELMAEKWQISEPQDEIATIVIASLLKGE